MRALKTVKSIFDSGVVQYDAIYSTLLTYGKEIANFQPLESVYNWLEDGPMLGDDESFQECLDDVIDTMASSNVSFTAWDILSSVVYCVAALEDHIVLMGFFQNSVPLLLNCTREWVNVQWNYLQNIYIVSCTLKIMKIQIWIH
jgi:hypothetical protein